MKSGAPELIAINHDDDHAEYVGRTPDGRQFFLTTPFVPASTTEAGREFVALFLFSNSGQFLEAHIDDFGARVNLDYEKYTAQIEQRLGSLGAVEFGRIQISPFSIEKFGVTFGLVPRQNEEEPDEWIVELHPGNYMAFFEPWDSGDYDS